MLGEILKDRLTKAIVIILGATVALVIFNHFSPLPHEYPRLGFFTFSMVIALAVTGAVIFTFSILKLIRRH